MKAQLLVLSAAGLLLSAAPLVAQAAPADVARYVATATEDAGGRLADRGVALGGKTVTVRARIGLDRLNGAQVVSTSGSAELDDQIASALRNVRTTKAPPELVGREVTLTLGQPSAAPAIAAR
jgi:hypothetical protein